MVIQSCSTSTSSTGWLKVAKDELEAPPQTVSHAGKLYLSEEAWVEKWKARDSKKLLGDGSGGRGGGWRGGAQIGVAKMVGTVMRIVHHHKGAKGWQGWVRISVSTILRIAIGVVNVLTGRRRRQPMWPRRRRLS
jgi:hypothetical protein